MPSEIAIHLVAARAEPNVADQEAECFFSCFSWSLMPSAGDTFILHFRVVQSGSSPGPISSLQFSTSPNRKRNQHLARVGLDQAPTESSCGARERRGAPAHFLRRLVTHSGRVTTQLNVPLSP